MSEEKILTTDDIRKLDNLNEEMIKEYCRLGEERLKDCLDTKKQLEQKSFILLGGYITISLALFHISMQPTIDISYGISACFLLIGIIFLLWSIKFSTYGNLGKNPKYWLQDKKYLILPNDHNKYIYAYNLVNLMERIEYSKKRNEKKRAKIIIAIYAGFFSLTPFIILFFHNHHLSVAEVEAVKAYLSIVFH